LAQFVQPFNEGWHNYANFKRTSCILGKLPDTKFIRKGDKMYSTGIGLLLDNLSTTEIKRVLALCDKKHMNYYNIITSKFNEVFADMDKSHRSRFKRKLLDTMILQEYNKRLMFNPYIFIPRPDRNIHNSQHLTQRVWTWMFTDKDAATDDIIKHAEHMFGKAPGNLSTQIVVGSGEYAALVDKPEPCK
jgi:hypothetical protein